MNTPLTVTKVTPRPFRASEDEGGMIDYYWYKGIRKDNGVTIEFGSRTEYEKGDQIEPFLEKTELANGKFRYKEVKND